MMTCASQMAVAARAFNDNRSLMEWDEPLNKIHGLLFGVGHHVHVRKEGVSRRVLEQVERVVVARHYSSTGGSRNPP